jgi:dihydrofolate reductase
VRRPTLSLPTDGSLASYIWGVGFRDATRERGPSTDREGSRNPRASRPGAVLRMSRKVTANLLVTLDGVAKFDPAVQQAIMELGDEQVEGYFARNIQEEDAMLLGRKTYEEWLNFWPTSEIQPFANHINNVPKYVVSTTLRTVSWPTAGKAHLLGGDLRASLGALKEQPGKNIGVHGSPSLVGSLIQAHLLDTLRLAVFPVVAGSGARVFGEGFAPERMQLVDSLIGKTGVAVLTYQPLGRM